MKKHHVYVPEWMVHSWSRHYGNHCAPKGFVRGNDLNHTRSLIPPLPFGDSFHLQKMRSFGEAISWEESLDQA
ncbi:MAG TPA: hypothetical protein DD706_18220 [Nitrospiraceae bacterium]|nr:hypothetical protein [Nitrospiraceae bacterium]